MTPLVVFRVDSGAGIGAGHFMRCLVLADHLASRGVRAHFICTERDGDLAPTLGPRGYALSRLPATAPSVAADGDYAAWLGRSQEEDAALTRAAVERLGDRPAWLVADHYGLDRPWESAMRAAVERILVITDLEGTAHDCDVLLDQNLAADAGPRHDGAVPPGCARLLGPAYALLNSSYADLHDRIPPRAGAIRRILVFFGGDDRCLTHHAIEAVRRTCNPDVALDVVTGSAAAADALRAAGPEPDGRSVTVYHGLPTLAPLIARADLCLGAGGSSNWERLCLGLPALVVTRAENQRPVARALHARGLAAWLGDESAVDAGTIAAALRPLCERGLDRAWSAAGFGVVDGQGTRRVADVMLAGPADPLEVRYATPADEGLVLGWANDPGTRRTAFTAAAIAPETHHRWFTERLRNVENCRFYLVETSRGTPIGQVRFERGADDWEVHYLLAPEFRGRGLGRPLLAGALTRLRADAGAVAVTGRVKHDNTASVKIFEALGFSAGPSGMPGVALFRRTC